MREEGRAISEQIEELTEEIEAKREHLGATVDELTDRLDVKKHASEKVGAGKEQVGGFVGRRDVRAGAAAAAAAGLLVTAIKTYKD